MPDSWIDKDELEELVGAFAPRPGRARKDSAPLFRPPLQETEAVEVSGAADDVPPPSGETRAPSVVEPPSSLERVVVFELDDEDDEDDGIEVVVEGGTVPMEEVAEPDPAEEPPPLPIEVVVAEPLEIQPRTVPWFLDEGEEPPPLRASSLSERDADRALTALAEARAKAERNHLLRVCRPPQQSVEETGAEESAVAPGRAGFAMEAPVAETEEDVEEGCLGFGLPVEEIETIESAFAALHERIAHFGESVRERLEAVEVAVCDHDGLLLYSSGNGGALETALLLEVAGRTDRLLGLGAGRATQVTLDGGVWRCLIRGAGAAEHLFAGFRLKRPIEPHEVEHCTRALAEAVRPAPPLPAN